MDWRCGSSRKVPAFSSNPSPIQKKRKEKNCSFFLLKVGMGNYFPATKWHFISLILWKVESFKKQN
jgi:hypothetical protein